MLRETANRFRFCRVYCLISSPASKQKNQATAHYTATMLIKSMHGNCIVREVNVEIQP